MSFYDIFSRICIYFFTGGVESLKKVYYNDKEQISKNIIQLQTRSLHIMVNKKTAIQIKAMKERVLYKAMSENNPFGCEDFIELI